MDGGCEGKVLSKPYEKDPEKRAEIYDNIAKKLPKILEERTKLASAEAKVEAGDSGKGRRA